MGKQCRFINELQKPKAPQAQDCQMCASQPQTVSFNGADTDINIVRVMLSKPEDQDAYLSDNFQSSGIDLSLIRGSLPNNSQSDYCGGYDPFATATAIEKLLDNKCVRAVYVPDRFLLNKFQRQASKVIYRPFLDDDRYSIELETATCSSPTAGSAAGGAK
mgnify:CR=1 FL=1